MKSTAVKKCVKCILVAVLVATLVINMVIAVLAFLEYNTEFEGIPYSVLTVQGESMSPEFSQGELLVLKKADYDSLNVGDDITFLTTGGLVTHRIVDVNDNGYVTRGLANNTEDLYEVNEQTYCGKVVTSIPYIGYALQYIGGSYIVLAVAIMLLFAACFARPIINKIREKKEETRKEQSSSLKIRLLACLCVLSLFLSLPYVTQTKYISEINRYETVVAQPLYFSSNYLSSAQDGNAYNIQGWDGKAYSLGLEIKNYNNELLFNGEDRDISYGLGIKINDGEYSTDYTVEITPATTATVEDTAEVETTPPRDGVTPFEGTFNFPSEWTEDGTNGTIKKLSAYTMLGGDKVTDRFDITVTPSGTLTENTKISFDIYAVTEQNKTYSILLHGTFSFQVSKSTSFLGELTLVNQPSMVNLTVRTYPSNDGSDEKVVVFQWDPQKMYLNEYQSTVFNIINSNPSNYYQKEQGRLYMKLQPYSMVTLEFFKREAGNIVAQDITVQVVDNVGDIPTTPTPPDNSEDTTT